MDSFAWQAALFAVMELYCLCVSLREWCGALMIVYCATFLFFDCVAADASVVRVRFGAPSFLPKGRLLFLPLDWEEEEEDTDSGIGNVESAVVSLLFAITSRDEGTGGGNTCCCDVSPVSLLYTAAVDGQHEGTTTGTQLLS